MPVKAFLPPVNIPASQYEVLLSLAREALEACKVTAHDGTVLLRPDGGGHYDAMWTRDFCYAVEGLGGLMDPAQILAGIDYLLAGQREDGVIPDRVRADGTPVYLAGPVDAPLGNDPPTDNAQFMVKAVSAYCSLTRDLDAFFDRRHLLYKAMESVPRSADKLVVVDPNRPHSGYGFTDCIAKTGNEFFSTILYWEASHTLAKLCVGIEYHDEAHEWYEQAEHTARRMQDFWDDSQGLYRAASVSCNQPDLWGSAYSCVIRAASKSQSRRVAEYFLRWWEGLMLRGHLRHLPAGEYWHRTLIDVPRDTYQNGGYWSVPSGWLAKTLYLVDAAVAQRLVAELVEEFAQSGVHEWIGETDRAVPGYVASVANVVGAVQGSKHLG